MTEEVTGLSIEDITLAHQVIDVALKRAAFQPGELEIIGGLYNRMHSFLEQVRAVEAAQAAAEAEAENPLPFTPSRPQVEGSNAPEEKMVTSADIPTPTPEIYMPGKPAGA